MNELELLLGQVYRGGSSGGGGGGSESTIAWKPTVDADGNISWNRTSSTTKPAMQNIKGEKGDKGEDGAAGADGAKGDTGEQGVKGDDGFSPVITVTDITGGHRVTIVDKDHPQGQSFDVMDGSGGGVALPAGGTTEQALVKKSNNDGDAEWKHIGTNFEVGVEKWYGTYTENGVTYQVYSKLIDIGALPSAAGVTQYPHGITGIKQVLQINGFTNDGFVMNAPRQNAQDNITIYQAQKNGNIVVEVGKDRSGKNGFVMLIYAKNN